jgi:hypothetical protein
MPKRPSPASGAWRPAPAAAHALAGVLLWALGGAAATAQTATVSGSVLNRDTRFPVDGARVSLIGAAGAASTDSAGRFELPGLAPGVRILQVRALGFVVGSWVVQLTEGQVLRQVFDLVPRAVEVEGVTLEAAGRSNDWHSEAAFEERRHRNQGFFFTREEIRRRNATNITDLLRSVPGVMTSCTARGCNIQMDRSTRQCRPEFFLDGLPATNSTGPNHPLNQVRGVEIYRDRFETPPEFQRANLQCGVIAIWTIDPGTTLERR